MANEDYDVDDQQTDEGADNSSGASQPSEAEVILNRLNEEAQELGFESHQEYKEYLEEEVSKSYSKEKQTDSKPPTKPAVKKVDDDKPDPYAEKFEKTEQAVKTTYIENQFTQFRLDQNDLPKEERAPYQKKELMKVIQGPDAALVRKLLEDPKYDGNMFAAAATVLDFDKLKKGVKDKETATEVAKRSEKETATIESGQSVPPAGKDERSENDILADEIIPDTEYQYPG